MKLYTGIDLHSNNHFVTIIDQHDQRVDEKRLKNNLVDTLALLEPYRKHIESIALESTYNWYWLADGLIDHGYKVKLVNTVAVQQYSGLKYTDDKSDAFWLAHLLRLGILPTGYIYPAKQRGLRDLLRKRLQLVEDRVRHVLRVQSQIIRSSGIHISSTDIKACQVHATDFIDDMNVVRAISADLMCIDTLNEEILSLEERVSAQTKNNPTLKRLRSVPGVGPILGTTILLETGDISRFAKAGNYASYCRCVAAGRYSNGKKKSVNNSKNGNKHLSRAFIEAAYYAARFYDQPKAFYERKAKQVNRTLATKALAHKLTKACYYIMRDNTLFDANRLFT